MLQRVPLLSSWLSSPDLPACGMEHRLQSCFSPSSSVPNAFSALVGMALGDALGAPFEGKRKGAIEQLWPTGTPYPAKLHPCGLVWTDDTQTSLSFMEAFMRTGKVEPTTVWQLWAQVSSIKLFEERGQPLSQHQFGLFRGTGGNFRKSVSAAVACNFSADVSCNTAGNGAAMRVTPLSIIAHLTTPTSTEDKAMQVLADLVYHTATMTHREFLGVVPAFSLGATILLLLRDPKVPAKELLRRVSTVTVMFENYFSAWQTFQSGTTATVKFEDYLSSPCQTFQTSGHHYSQFLQSVTDMWPSGLFDNSSMAKFEEALSSIVKFATSLSPKTVCPNDGIAVASVSTAIIAGVLLRDQPFLGVLQTVYQLGGDTDTTGAMLGAILGAANPTGIPAFVSNQLICHQQLFTYFENFISTAKLGTQQQCTSWPDLERAVTLQLLDTPNGFRNDHFNSTQGPYFTDHSPSTYFSTVPSLPHPQSGQVSSYFQQPASSYFTASLAPAAAAIYNAPAEYFPKPSTTEAFPAVQQQQRCTVNYDVLPVTAAIADDASCASGAYPNSEPPSQEHSGATPTSADVSYGSCSRRASDQQEVLVTLCVNYRCTTNGSWLALCLQQQKTPVLMDYQSETHDWVTSVPLPAGHKVKYHFEVMTANGTQRREYGNHCVAVPSGARTYWCNAKWQDK
eukprot:TRINITY_DN1616_c0_g1_i7.p1 TRINITY_DN1616_c0_g1~~TRINITY_DN1616_c0_g1_i7.p1  ORF type:complete len:680 (+),score=113.66 TRINITY_DN1616_c0_g1_i7:71-2110(+)